MKVTKIIYSDIRRQDLIFYFSFLLFFKMNSYLIIVKFSIAVDLQCFVYFNFTAKGPCHTDTHTHTHTHIYIHIYYTYIIAFSHYPPTFYIPVHILIFRDKEIIFEKANGLHSMFLTQKISEKMWMKQVSLITSGNEDWVDRGKRGEEDSTLQILSHTSGLWSLRREDLLKMLHSIIKKVKHTILTSNVIIWETRQTHLWSWTRGLCSFFLDRLGLCSTGEQEEGGSCWMLVGTQGQLP